MTTTAQKLTALFARSSTPALTGALVMLEAAASLTAEERWARAQTIKELEARFPAAEAAVTAAFDAAEESGAEVDYVAVLLANIPA